MAKLTKIVLHFDDGTTHEVERGYNAVYTNPGRAKKANEREPWGKPPHARDTGKDDAPASSEFDPGSGCYIINNAIICP